MRLVIREDALDANFDPYQSTFKMESSVIKVDADKNLDKEKEPTLLISKNSN